MKSVSVITSSKRLLWLKDHTILMDHRSRLWEEISPLNLVSQASFTCIWCSERLEGEEGTAVVITANTINTTAFQGTTRVVNVYPGSSNCSSITNRDLCLRIPQCIFCLRYPDIRILREVDSFSRRLYADLVPPSNGYAIQVYDDTKYGVCADGFHGDSCTAEILSLHTVNAAAQNFDTSKMIISFCTLVATLMIFSWLQ